ncbi:heavy-metal-associated domain-containing protein [Microvirga roseola]|uniref:heavy-metal-associated domain-containing protein n=1 Tax=Microvirga roseola TaxID=2883126 RepID=UPI001E31EBBD|nr:heavy-metal-associated domain-containing protein [Microvirga roseola]
MERYRVSGMTCGHCALAVTREVESLKGVERAVIDLSRGELTVEGRADEDAIRGAVTKAGYTVEERLSQPAA